MTGGYTETWLLEKSRAYQDQDPGDKGNLLPYDLTVSLIRYVTYACGGASVVRGVAFVTSRCPIIIAQYKHNKEKDNGKSLSEQGHGQVERCPPKETSSLAPYRCLAFHDRQLGRLQA